MVGGSDSILDRAIVALSLGHMLTSCCIVHTHVEFVSDIIHETSKFLVTMDELEKISRVVVLAQNRVQTFVHLFGFLRQKRNSGPETNRPIDGRQKRDYPHKHDIHAENQIITTFQFVGEFDIFVDNGGWLRARRFAL